MADIDIQSVLQSRYNFNNRFRNFAFFLKVSPFTFSSTKVSGSQRRIRLTTLGHLDFFQKKRIYKIMSCHDIPSECFFLANILAIEGRLWLHLPVNLKHPFPHQLLKRAGMEIQIRRCGQAFRHLGNYWNLHLFLDVNFKLGNWDKTNQPKLEEFKSSWFMRLNWR